MFGVHRSSYRYWEAKDKQIPAERIRLLSEVSEAHRLSGGSAGARTIASIVTNKELSLSRYRASKLMKSLGLVSCQQPKHAYRKASQEHVVIPNTLDRKFDAKEPNTVWCGDVHMDRRSMGVLSGCYGFIFSTPRWLGDVVVAR